MKKTKTYMVLLVDRQKAKMFTVVNGSVQKREEISMDQVPQKVKHGDNIWDSQKKIFRHIEDHLHRHLVHVAQKAAIFAKKNQISELIIGSHRPLFSKIKKHLLYPLNRKIKGEFVTELKAPFGVILKNAIRSIEKLEKNEEIKRYEDSLAVR